MTMSPDHGFEYVADSQWAGWWGGYGAEHLLAREINERAADGWRLHTSEAKGFLWFGITAWPPRVPALVCRIRHEDETALHLRASQTRVEATVTATRALPRSSPHGERRRAATTKAR